MRGNGIFFINFYLVVFLEHFHADTLQRFAAIDLAFSVEIRETENLFT